MSNEIFMKNRIVPNQDAAPVVATRVEAAMMPRDPVTTGITRLPDSILFTYPNGVEVSVGMGSGHYCSNFMSSEVKPLVSVEVSAKYEGKFVTRHCPLASRMETDVLAYLPLERLGMVMTWAASWQPTLCARGVQ